MFRSIVIVLLLLAGFSINLASQEVNDLKSAKYFLNTYGEVYLTFVIDDRHDLREITDAMSIDRVIGDTVIVNVNRQEFDYFLTLDYDFTVISKEPDKSTINQAKSLNDLIKWDSYPAHSQYLELMSGFSADYPDICLLDTIGTSIHGKPILTVKLSDNVHEEEPEPDFFYTASMHGDETPPFILMLRLIDYLLTEYDNDQEITRLINNMEIWINPLSNPDGMYRNGADTIFYPIRRNAEGIDLNRNFPDPVKGQFPNYAFRAHENKSMIAFMELRRFDLAANLHTGFEVINIPWDVWKSDEKLHADVEWYRHIGREYTKLAHENSPEGYLVPTIGGKIKEDGVTVGGDWYVVHGGRQDYTNYFLQGREVIMELDNDKNPSGAELPALWDYNRDALIACMKQALYGLKGKVFDAETSQPVAAKIEIPAHDKDNSFVFSSLEENGYFYRFLDEGSYTIMATAPGYDTTYVNDISIQKNTLKTINIPINPVTFSKLTLNIFDALNGLPLESKILIYDNDEKLIHQVESNPDNGLIALHLPVGVYQINITNQNYYAITKSLTLREEQDIIDSIYLIPKNFGAITGIVKDFRDSTPVFATISLFNNSGQIVKTTHSDLKTGKFLVFYKQGHYTMEIFAEGFDTTKIKNVTIIPDDTLCIDTTLTPVSLETAIVAGNIIDVSTQLPVQANIVLQDSTGSVVFENSSNPENGYFAFSVPEGIYKILILNDNYYEISSVYSLTSEQKINENFHAIPLGMGILTGQVIDINDSLPVYATINIIDDNGQVVKTVYPDANTGNYFCAIEQGEYIIRAFADGHYKSQSDNILVQAGDTITIYFQLEPLPASLTTISGNIYDISTYLPVIATISVFDSTGDIFYQGRSDSNNGFYSFSLPKGHFTFHISNNDYFEISKKIIVQSNQTLNEDFYFIPKGTGIISGRVVNKQDSFPVFAEIELSDKYGQMVKTTYSDASTGYFFIPYRQGIYDLTAFSGNFDTVRIRDISISPGDTTNTDIAMTPVSISVVDLEEKRQPVVTTHNIFYPGNLLLINSQASFTGYLYVFDISGRELYKKSKIRLYKGKNTIHLGFNKIPKGLFVVHISNNEGVSLLRTKIINQ